MASKKIERGLVVVGVDGSAQSIAALRWAARYAAATSAAMRAVLAGDHPSAAASRQWDWRPPVSGPRSRPPCRAP